MTRIKRMAFCFVVLALLVPTADCAAQKLKLPNLLPFRKKATQEVKPIKLSDGAAPRIQNSPGKERGVFDFLKPKSRNAQNAMANEVSKTKSFFQKTGDEIGQFADETKQFFEDAWNPPRAKKAWWNQGTRDFAAQPKKPFFKWPTPKANQVQLPPPPMPRTARQYQNGEPRYRFK